MTPLRLWPLTFLLFFLQGAAIGGDAIPPAGPQHAPLVVQVTSEVDNDVIKALDLRDLEHYLVSQLIRHRVEDITPASTLERSQTPLPDDSYLLEFSIEEAEQATRPRWNWSEQRFVDDGILHLEVSITLTRTGDDTIVGGVNDIREFRAADFGPFSTPQAVRGAAYKAAASLVDDFVRAATGGEFGEDLREIKRPNTPADLVHDWTELPADWKTATAAMALLVFVLVLGLAIRIVYALAQLVYWILVPPGLRVRAAPLYPRLEPPARRRKADLDLELDEEPSEEETDEEEEEGEEEQTKRRE